MIAQSQQDGKDRDLRTAVWLSVGGRDINARTCDKYRDEIEEDGF
jgi:hypothetical protein